MLVLWQFVIGLTTPTHFSLLLRRFNTDEMTKLKEFVRSEGKDAYQQLRHDSASAFPGYANELRGIAAGANVSLEDVWTNILMVELENLNNKTKDHCSDISAISNSGYRDGFAHGHNEVTRRYFKYCYGI